MIGLKFSEEARLLVKMKTVNQFLQTPWISCAVLSSLPVLFGRGINPFNSDQFVYQLTQGNNNFNFPRPAYNHHLFDFAQRNSVTTSSHEDTETAMGGFPQYSHSPQPVKSSGGGKKITDNFSSSDPSNDIHDSFNNLSEPNQEIELEIDDWEMEMKTEIEIETFDIDIEQETELEISIESSNDQNSENGFETHPFYPSYEEISKAIEVLQRTLMEDSQLQMLNSAMLMPNEKLQRDVANQSARMPTYMPNAGAYAPPGFLLNPRGNRFNRYSNMYQQEYVEDVFSGIVSANELMRMREGW